MNKHKPYQRLMAAVLSVTMVLGMTPVSVAAETPSVGTSSEIIAFEPLPEETANQTVPLGTSISDLDLPASLSATVHIATAADTEEQQKSTEPEEPIQDSGNPLPQEDKLDDGAEPTLGEEPTPQGEEAVGNATPSEGTAADDGEPAQPQEPAAGDSEPAQPQEPAADDGEPTQPKEPVANDGEPTQPKADEKATTIAVTWDCAEYDGETEGTYTFTAKLNLADNVVLAAGVPVPTIEVEVTADLLPISMALNAVSEYNQNDIAVIDALIDAHPELELEWTKSQPGTWPKTRVEWSQDVPKRITMLDLGVIGLTGKLDVSGLSELERFFCSGNKLTELDLSKNTNLKNYWGTDQSPKPIQFKYNLATNQFEADIALNSPSFENNGLSYENGKLISNSNAIAQSCFTVKVGMIVEALDNLTGTLTFSYDEIPDYHPDDIAAIDKIIDAHNELGWTPSQPESWSGVTWSTTEPKRIIELVLNDKSLTGKLDVSGLPALRTLSCQKNNLTQLNVSDLPALTNLSCPSNQLTQLNVSGLPSLQSLNCDDNKLTQLKVSGLKALEYLYCSSNQLTQLDLSKNTKLTTFYGSGQKPTINLIKSGEDYKASIALNNPTGFGDGISYENGMLISKDNNIEFSPFVVETGKEGHLLGGRLNLTYKQQAYTVTVSGGTASPAMATAGTTVTITANTATNGQRFQSWTVNSGSVALDNANAASTTFTMPANNVSVTANWESNSGGNGGGGGSSSGGSSSSTTTPATTTPEKTPNQPITAAAPVTATAGQNGYASASIPEKSVTDAIAKAQADAKAQGKTANGTTVALNVTMPKGATALTATLTEQSLNSLVSAGVTSLELNGSPVTVSFDKKALTEIQKQSNGNINITIAPNTNLTAAAKTMIGTRPVYDITVGYGSGKTVSSFRGGVATVSIPYTLGKNETVGGVYAVYVDAKGNVTRIAGSAYDANSKSVIFATTHFSLYGIGYTAPSAKFKDISSHWAKESIDYVVGRGLFGGNAEGKFNPDTAITRSDFVTALGKLSSADVKTYTASSFTDVKVGSYYLPYIEWAYQTGIIQGIGNSQFAPERAITREEIAVIFSNYAKATGYTLPVTRNAVTYADTSSIGSPYKTAVTAMQQAGIMTGGTGNKFNPKSNATRAEVSSMLHRYIKLTIDPATAQGWALDDAGQYLYYKSGKVLTGTQTIDGTKYFFNIDGTLKTGWVKDDAGNWRFYSGNIMLVGFWDLGANGDNKTYYFNKDGIMANGKWLQIDGKWYYFNADGSLAKNAKIDGHEVDANGVRKTK